MIRCIGLILLVLCRLLSFAQEIDSARTLFFQVRGDSIFSNEAALKNQLKHINPSCIEHLHISTYEGDFQFQNGKNTYPEFFCIYENYTANLKSLYSLIPWNALTQLNQITLPFCDSISPNYFKNNRRFFTLNWTYGIIYPYALNHVDLPIKALQIGKPNYAKLHHETFLTAPSRLRRFALPEVPGVTEISSLNYLGLNPIPRKEFLERDFNLSINRLGNFEHISITYDSISLQNNLALSVFQSAKNIALRMPTFTRKTGGIDLRIEELTKLKRLVLEGEFWLTSSDGKVKGNILNSNTIEYLTVSNYDPKNTQFEGGVNIQFGGLSNSIFKQWNPYFIASLAEIRCPNLIQLDLSTNFNFPDLSPCTALQELVLYSSNLKLTSELGVLSNLKTLKINAMNSDAQLSITDTFLFKKLNLFEFAHRVPAEEFNPDDSLNTSIDRSLSKINLAFLAHCALQKVILTDYNSEIWNNLKNNSKFTDTLVIEKNTAQYLQKNELWNELKEFKNLAVVEIWDKDKKLNRAEILALLPEYQTIIWKDGCY